MLLWIPTLAHALLGITLKAHGFSEGNGLTTLGRFWANQRACFNKKKKKVYGTWRMVSEIFFYSPQNVYMHVHVYLYIHVPYIGTRTHTILNEWINYFWSYCRVWVDWKQSRHMSSLKARFLLTWQHTQVRDHSIDLGADCIPKCLFRRVFKQENHQHLCQPI